jgi:hypothetical protein
VRTADEATVDHQSSSYAGPEDDAKDDGASPCCAKPRFGQSEAIRVVFKDDLDTEKLFQIRVKGSSIEAS